MAEAAVGRGGESVAARYLERLGYTIRARNYRGADGEVDLIASNEEYVVFVEVKTRAADAGYHPTLAVTEEKKQRVRRAGEHYCAQHPEAALQPRFDVVAVTLHGRGARRQAHVEHYPDAF